MFTCFCDVKLQEVRNFPELVASAVAQWRSKTLWNKIEDPISSLSESPKAMGAETSTLKKLYRHDKHAASFPREIKKAL